MNPKLLIRERSYWNSIFCVTAFIFFITACSLDGVHFSALLFLWLNYNTKLQRTILSFPKEVLFRHLYFHDEALVFLSEFLSAVVFSKFLVLFFIRPCSLESSLKPAKSAVVCSCWFFLFFFFNSWIYVSELARPECIVFFLNFFFVHGKHVFTDLNVVLYRCNHVGIRTRKTRNCQ